MIVWAGELAEWLHQTQMDFKKLLVISCWNESAESILLTSNTLSHFVLEK